MIGNLLKLAIIHMRQVNIFAGRQKDIFRQERNKNGENKLGYCEIESEMNETNCNDKKNRL